jgi:3-hydroxyisobutyrate dehydrogenase
MTRRATTVAALGTGIMGAAMARSPLRAGLDVAAWNRTPSRAEPPAADGARTAASAAEAAESADVVVTMVHDASAALDAVRAAAPGPRPGAVRLQTATVGPGGLPRPTASAREHGLVHVDAPVPRTRAPAHPRARRGRGADGAGLQYRGAATRLKPVRNPWLLTVTHGVAEALGLAKGPDVDPRDFLDAVAGGPLDMGCRRARAALLRSGEAGAGSPSAPPGRAPG